MIKPHRESGGGGSKKDAKREAAQVFKIFIFAQVFKMLQILSFHTWSSIFSGFQNDSNFEVFSLSLFQKMIDKLKSMGPNNGPAQVCHIFMQISASIQMFVIHQI